MDHTDIDWDALNRLRSRFLGKDAGGTGVYWQDEEELALYHTTFAERIGWKWDNALDEAERVGFTPTSRKLMDWGCGSGIASLRVIERLGADAFDSVCLWDHSPIACRFAANAIKDRYPDLDVTVSASPENDIAGSLTLTSHTLNELSPESFNRLAETLKNATQVFAVEPGDYAASHRLVSLRECLSEQFSIVAPCTHCDACPMTLEENSRHWCHFFGKPPLEAFTESFWTHFSRTLEIDIRSLPYSFLVLSKASSKKPDLENASRLIGRARQFKGYSRLLSCDAHGLRELELQKRDDKQLWKTLKKETTCTAFRWNEIDLETNRLKSGQSL